DPKAIVGSLGIAKRQFVEIAKALSQGARLVIMDEPTSSLSLNETQNLFDVIQTLKNSGITLIYISHKLKEIFEIADSVTVLRDGEFIATKDVTDCTEQNLVELMVGRKITTLFPKTEVKLGDPVFRVENLSRANEFHDIS
ncbi:MAG TPA: D-xylose ABC transporter ATP-binding protein, partial [Firmicutes bacterium]|nr:D-xylose ABC transporter ATP-binding protein [Bacillota bacterium]